MAESSSESVVEAPRIEVPPVTLIFVFDVLLVPFFLAGDADRLEWAESEMRYPAAEGGNFERRYAVF